MPYRADDAIDNTARQIAKVMPKHLPNKVHILVKNIPGTGRRKGFGQLNRAIPDGYIISEINILGASIPKLTDQEVSFDSTKSM